jgi:hypothetical protein
MSRDVQSQPVASATDKPAVLPRAATVHKVHEEKLDASFDVFSATMYLVCVRTLVRSAAKNTETRLVSDWLTTNKVDHPTWARDVGALSRQLQVALGSSADHARYQKAVATIKTPLSLETMEPLLKLLKGNTAVVKIMDANRDQLEVWNRSYVSFYKSRCQSDAGLRRANSQYARNGRGKGTRKKAMLDALKREGVLFSS